MSVWHFRRERIQYSRAGQAIKFTGPSRYEKQALTAEDSPEISIKHMPRRYYRRRRSFKRYYPRRRRAISGGRNAGRIALRKIKQMERNQEKKELRAVNQTSQIPIAGAFQVNGFAPYCAQGTTDATRIGDKITVTSIMVPVNIQLTGAEAQGCSVRIILVMDRRPGGADPGVTDVLTDDDILAPINRAPAVRGRFQVLFDRTISFSANICTWDDRFYKKTNILAKYEGNAGTVADLQAGHLVMLSGARGNAAAINVDWGFRILFTDE